jgi:hypothetical protein
MRSLWQSLVKIFLITSLFSGCAGIPGKNVKLENYPEAGERDKNLNLSFGYFNTEKNTDEYHQFNYAVSTQLNKYFIQQSTKVPADTACFIKVSTKNEIKEDGLCEPYFAITFFTLFTIPFYCQHNYQATATLIHYPLESSLKDRSININPKQVDFSNNKIEIKHAKQGNYLLTEDKQRINEGEYFLDENNNLAKLLKTYELKDKVHEVWSSLWMLSWFVINPTKYAPNAEHPKDAKKIVENTISEALVRQILNDAKSFPECQKNDDGKDRDQKNLSNK